MNNDHDENFLHSKNLLITPPSRKSRRRTVSPSQTSPQLPLGNVINTPEVGAERQFDAAAKGAVDEDVVIPDTYPSEDKNESAEAEATFLTPQRKAPASQVLVPETPIAEMGLTYVEKSAIARRRLRDAGLNQDLAR